MSDNGQITSKTIVVLTFCLVLFIILIVAFCTIGRKRKTKPTAPPKTLPSRISAPLSSHRRPSGQTTTNTGGTPFLSKWSSRLDRARRGHARKNSDDIESVASSRDSDETLYDRGEAEQLEMGRTSLKEVQRDIDLDIERVVVPPPPVHYHPRRESM